MEVQWQFQAGLKSIIQWMLWSLMIMDLKQLIILKFGRKYYVSIAKTFAERHGLKVEDWMEWDGWTEYVGCNICDELGPDAECWGYTGCHGYINGCGCKDCAEIDQHEKELVQKMDKWEI
jgi:hypothetical protein